jgi:putative MFS transporter
MRFLIQEQAWHGPEDPNFPELKQNTSRDGHAYQEERMPRLVPPDDDQRRRRRRSAAFAFGIVACAAGVLLHLPMYLSARGMGYRMAGMRPDPAMISGMVLIGIGLATFLYGLTPHRSREIELRARRIRVRALDDVPLRRRHVALLVVLAVAVTLDLMKPITLSFVAPGMATEYGLKSPAHPHGGLPVSLLPLVAITGTVLGSLVWGALADRIGRRASILFAAMLFVTTAICGAMPGFSWNLLMCFIMGAAVGGMLPVAFSLMAETIPARHRGWLMVLIGGNAAGAYVITSWLAGALTPHFSWRILWLLGMPTGLLLIGLNRWIPESPRYLLATGRSAEAELTMAYYGAAVISEESPGPPLIKTRVSEGFAQLLRRPFTGITLAASVLALGTGLITYGFQLWIPTNLQHLGLGAVNSDYMIRDAALVSLPVTFAAALLYGFWSSRRTIAALSALTTLSLLGFAVGGNSLAHNHLFFSALLVIPLSGVSSVTAAISAYVCEIYPTRVRSRGTGIISGMTKAGGVLIIGIVAAATTIPSISVTALIGIAPLLIATLIFTRSGTETSNRRLEEITNTAERVASDAI